MASLQGYKKELPYSYAPGIFPSMEAVMKRKGQCTRLIVHSKGEHSSGLQKLLDLCAGENIRVEQADKALSRISGKENTFAAMVFNKFEDQLEENRPHLVLHQLSDMGNIGTLLRTALGFGYQNIALITPCADVFDPHGIRSSMGAVFSLKLAHFTSFGAYQQAFPAHYMYPFMLDGSQRLNEVVQKPVIKPYSLVLGNEGRGLPPDFATMGSPVRIDHSGDIDSLNVAVAGAIGMYAFCTAENKE